MIRDSFIFYRSFFEATKPLSTEQKAALFDTICGFALDHNEQDNDDLIVGAMFSLIKPQLAANYNKFKAGKKSAESKQKVNRTATERQQNGNRPLTNVNVECNNDNDNVNDLAKAKRRFTAPSLLDVQELFIKKLGNTEKTKLEAEQFYNFYGAKGWLIGKNKMKSLPHAVINWITRKKIEQYEKPNKEARTEQLQASTNREFGVSL